MTDHDLRPPSQQRRNSSSRAGSGAWVWGVIGLAVAAGSGWWFWQRQAPAELSPPQTQVAPQAPVTLPPAEPAVADAPPVVMVEQTAAAPQHPLEVQTDMNAEDAAALEQVVTEWLGRENALRFVALQGLAHHTVATVDNLARSHAAPRLWPLYPVGGRMVVTEDAEGTLSIAPANTRRYDAVVGFLGALDAKQAAAVYRRVYPVLQRAYEELGYPGKHFNDRLVQVIDHLLQTPQPKGPLTLQLVQVQSAEQGSAAPVKPWLRYEYQDERLQRLSAGQKMLLRIGPDHAQVLRGQLHSLRAEIASSAASQHHKKGSAIADPG